MHLGGGGKREFDTVVTGTPSQLSPLSTALSSLRSRPNLTSVNRNVSVDSWPNQPKLAVLMGVENPLVTGGREERGRRGDPIGKPRGGRGDPGRGRWISHHQKRRDRFLTNFWNFGEIIEQLVKL